MANQEIIRLFKQTRDLLTFHQALGMKELPRSAALERFLRGPAPESVPKSHPAPEPRKMPPPGHAAIPVTPGVSLTSIQEESAACRRCACGEESTRISGAGCGQSGLLVILDPQLTKESTSPVDGAAAELLHKMLAAIDLAREKVYITSLLKCSLDRPPSSQELENCLDLLRREIAAAAPRIICTMGPLAASILLRSSTSIFALRGRFQAFQGLPLMPTFHPAFLLKNPEMKKAAWLDLQAIQKQLPRS